MSAMAGIFRFDPRDPVDKKQLMELANGIDRIGPDGGGEHLESGLGMAYRAFHTTLESRLEKQPLVRLGSILTWDGRLDNREEILARLSQKSNEVSTDIDLVFAAYQEWGTGCFQDLIGDWALALWDQAKQQLILARDYIGVRRLFYRLDEGAVAWCTTIEPLVWTSPRKLHLDLDYLAGCLYPRPPVETTPYQEIRSVIPASFLTFQLGGKRTIEQYWCLNPNSQIRFAADSDYEEQFRDIFRQSVRRRLRADRSILAELSGGLDSSSIVCMADDIRAEEPGMAIETISYYDTDEPSGDERSFFEVVEKLRGRAGHRISVTEFERQTSKEALAPLPDEYFAATPGYFAKSLHWAARIETIQQKTGTRVILSGLGGDEILGGVQYEAPELADHLRAGRIASFFQSTLRWALARRKTVYRLLGDTFTLLCASYQPGSLLTDSIQSLPWAHLKPIADHRNLRTFAHWQGLSPVLLFMESIRYGLAQQLTCTDPPLVGCVERRYPYLDRSLFVFLASIPRTQVLQAGRRRHLMRRALRGIVPDRVLFRKTKWFGLRSSVASLNEVQEILDSQLKGDWLSDTMVVDVAALREHLPALQHGSSGDPKALHAAVAIELWLRLVHRRGMVDLAPAQAKSCPARPHLESCS